MSGATADVASSGRPKETPRMEQFQGQTLSWSLKDGIIELALHREPLNEIGSLTLEELEKFVATLEDLSGRAHALIVYSTLKSGFCAGADLRELYQWIKQFGRAEVANHARAYLERIHRVMNAIDASPLATIAAVHGVTFGGGFELALTCDLIIADKMARFCFPELRLGLIPGYGGIPRLKRDLGNAVVRDLLLTGRSFNANKAQQIGLVSQVVGEGEALRGRERLPRNWESSTAPRAATANDSSSRFPTNNSGRNRPLLRTDPPGRQLSWVSRNFVESTDAQPYLALTNCGTNLYAQRRSSSRRSYATRRGYFKVPRRNSRRTTISSRPLGIDSLQTLDLLTKLENHFRVELPDYELQGVSDFRTLAGKIQARL